MTAIRYSLPVFLFLLLVTCAACGSGRSGAATAPQLRHAVLAGEAPDLLAVERELYDPDKAINHAGFSLFVLNPWGEIAPLERQYYDFTVRTLMNGDTFVSVFARGLRDSAASLLVLKYNPDEWKLREALPGSLYGGRDESIFVAVERFAGTLPFGLARVRPQDNGLISGDGLVAEIAFSPGPAPGPRTVSATVTAQALLLKDLQIVSVGNEMARLTWNDQLRGDYDNSGKVNIADVTPIAIYFGGQVGDEMGNDAAEGFIDTAGNGDNVVSIADVTPLAVNFGLSIEGYNIRRSVQGHPEVPEKVLPNQLVTGSPLSIDRKVSEQYSPAQYLYEDATVSEDMVGSSTTFVYKLVPVGDGGEAPHSVTGNVVIGLAEDNEPPHGPQGPPGTPYIGITAMDAGDSRIKISYRRNARDVSQPIRYFLYLGYPGSDAGIDLEGATVLEVTETPSPYIWSGLTNGTTYAAYLAAEDAVGNRTSPVAAAVKTATPSAGARNDFEPPVWVDTVGAVEVVRGNGGFRVSFGPAVDAQSPPVRYRVYFPVATEPTFDTATFLETDSSPFSVTSLTNNTLYHVYVRAIDSADRYDPPTSPNEDGNTVVLEVTPGAAEGDIRPPVWDDTVGVVRAVPGDGTIRVEFGSATDEHSPPVTYTIYYQEGGAVDFGPDTHSLETTSTFPPTFISGLTNGQEYAVIVRAKDALGNEEKNQVLRTATPAVDADNLPPEWDDTVGIQHTSAGNGLVDVSWNGATDAQSPPVSYRVYWEEGDAGITDYARAITEGRTALTSNLYYRVDGLQNNVTYSFAVRALDSFTEPNEDYNTVYLTDAPKLVVNYRTELVDDDSLPVQYTSLNVASDGTVGIAYAVADEVQSGEFVYELRYATNETGNWTTETVCGGTAGDSRGKMPSLQFDASGVPHIAFVNNTHEYDPRPDTPYTTIERVTRTAPGAWTAPETIDDGGTQIVFINPSLAFSSTGVPAVAYVSWSAPEADDDDKLWYAEWRGSSWRRERLGVSAGGWGNQDASNCALAFGTFAFAGVPAHEMPTIAFSNPAQTNQLSWVLKNEDDDWRWGYRLGEAMTCSVSLCIWETEYEGNPLWLPRIGYHDEFEQAFYVARSYVEENQIRWDTHRVNFTGSPGTGYYTNVAMAFEAGYELIFASCYNLALNRAELGIENLLNPDSYFLHQVPPADGGRYLSMGLVRVGGNDKAALSLVKDGNLYVSVME